MSVQETWEKFHNKSFQGTPVAELVDVQPMYSGFVLTAAASVKLSCQ